MNQRKLSGQQRARIKQQQDSSNDQTGLVIANFGRRLDVQLDNGGEVTSCRVRTNIDTLVAGDRVRVSTTKTISALLPRDSELLRPDGRGRLRPVAANVDQVFVVVAPEPQAFANLIDRYLVAIAISKMRAVLVLNKIDLLSDRDSELIHMLASYERLGFDVLRVSANSGKGLAELQQAFASGTGVLVGQSGVGKSSLVNALYPQAVTPVGELSSSNEQEGVSRDKAKGTHTTTTARLFHLPDGGALIDSPGVREFQLWHVPAEEILAGFPDLAELASECKFRNCAHGSEKGCRVQQAVAKDAHIAQRWNSYAQIRDQL